MVDYKEMYLSLFNAVTDALEQMSRGDVAAVKQTLETAQQATEEMYIEGGNENGK